MPKDPMKTDHAHCSFNAENQLREKTTRGRETKFPKSY